MVLQDCPKCHGSGTFCQEVRQEDGDVAVLESCPQCNGEGATGHIEPYFKNNSPEMSVVPYIEGWIRCPNCSRKFALKDKNAWTGQRHIRCGQKITVVKI